LKSFDTSEIGEPLRGKWNEPELFGELPGVRRRVGGDGAFINYEQ